MIIGHALDLFCGAGGASIGLERAGYDVLGVDHDPAAVVTARRNGHRCLLAEAVPPPIYAIHASHRFDLVWGSPPCQPFSTSGHGLGQDDERDELEAFVQYVCWIQPRVAILENVPALSWRKHRPYLEDQVLWLLQNDYYVDYKLLNAADFGVPQTRQRLFLIARLDEEPRWPAPSHGQVTDQMPLFKDRDSWVSVAEALGLDNNLLVNNHWERGTRPAGEPSQTVTASGFCRLVHRNNSGDSLGRSLPRDRPLDEPGYTVTHKPFRLVSNQLQGTGKPNERQDDEPAQTVTSRGDQYRFVLDHRRDFRDGRSQCRELDEPAATLGTSRHQAQFRQTEDGTVYRNLTIQEAGILQGFPADYRWPAKSTAAWKQVGNAVPPVMAELLARENRPR